MGRALMLRVAEMLEATTGHEQPMSPEVKTHLCKVVDTLDPDNGVLYTPGIMDEARDRLVEWINDYRAEGLPLEDAFFGWAEELGLLDG